MRLVNAVHLGLIAPLPVGLCYAGCPGIFIAGGCDCPAFFNL